MTLFRHVGSLKESIQVLAEACCEETEALREEIRGQAEALASLRSLVLHSLAAQPGTGGGAGAPTAHTNTSSRESEGFTSGAGASRGPASGPTSVLVCDPTVRSVATPPRSPWSRPDSLHQGSGVGPGLPSAGHYSAPGPSDRGTRPPRTASSSGTGGPGGVGVGYPAPSSSLGQPLSVSQESTLGAGAVALSQREGWERSVTPPRTVVTVTAGGEDPGTATGNIIGVEFPRAGEGASVDRDGSSVGGYASGYGSYGGRIGGSALAAKGSPVAEARDRVRAALRTPLLFPQAMPHTAGSVRSVDGGTLRSGDPWAQTPTIAQRDVWTGGAPGTDRTHASTREGGRTDATARPPYTTSADGNSSGPGGGGGGGGDVRHRVIVVGGALSGAGALRGPAPPPRVEQLVASVPRTGLDTLSMSTVQWEGQGHRSTRSDSLSSYGSLFGR